MRISDWSSDVCSSDLIVFIGRLSAQKNPLLLIEALEGLDLELDMVGDGDLRATAEREAARRGVKARLHGNLPHQNLPEMINAGRIFVLPSSYEGHPKTLLRSEEHTSELQSLMRISYAVFC